jgi:pyruvate/2-oxoglutarate dehydrogenase complex dihydrolipoamide acyltransferase (E2) component
MEIDTMATTNTTSTTTRKPTKRQMFEGRLTIPTLTQEQKDFIKHELELLAKKNSADKKPTAQQTANEAVKTAILDGMEVNRLYTITELIKEIPECADMTNQKVSALVRQLVDAGSVAKTVDKRKSYFSLIVGE